MFYKKNKNIFFDFTCLLLFVPHSEHIASNCNDITLITAEKLLQGVLLKSLPTLYNFLAYPLVAVDLWKIKIDFIACVTL